MDLIDAIRVGETIEVIEDLITERGLLIDNQWLDYGALNFAIKCRRMDVAQLLLENNCRVNKIPDPGAFAEPSNTPLHNAVKQGDKDLVENLLQKNASITVVNSQGNTPLHLAFTLEFHKITNLILRFIQQTDTYVNLKNKYGLSHFHIACTRENICLVESFMEVSRPNVSDFVNKDSPYYPGFTVMQFAVEFKCPRVLQFLVQHQGICPTNQVLKTIRQAKKYMNDMSVMIHLLSDYAQVENLDESSKISQFHVACLQNDVPLIKTFLDCGIDVSSAISEESAFCPLWSMLHFAIEANCIESVQVLLERGADPDQPDAKDMTPLHLAFYKNNETILDLVYAATKRTAWNLDISDCNGLHYFHVAISRNDIELVKYFISKGQNVNARVSHNDRDFSGYTPLHFAVRYGHLEVANVLIQCGADINASDMDKNGTPIHMSFSAANGSFITLLMQYNARFDCLRPCDDKTVLHLLVEKHMNLGIREVPIVNDYVKTLVFFYGINVNAKDRTGYTALHYACSNIAVGAPCAKTLIECGADINAVNQMGDTPFKTSLYNLCRDNANDYAFLYHHVKGLKTLGFIVVPDNHNCCERLLLLRKNGEFTAKRSASFKTRRLLKMQKQRDEEMSIMENTEVWTNTSMFGFIMKNSTELSAIGINNYLTNLIETGQLRPNFPHFGYMVEFQYRVWTSHRPQETVFIQGVM